MASRKPREPGWYPDASDPDAERYWDGTQWHLVATAGPGVWNYVSLAYDSVRASDVPVGFAEIARRMAAAEERRGASRVDPPEQEVEQLADGTFQLAFRPLLQSEQDNAALSLAANMAIADAMFAHHTGLFRVMSVPDAFRVQRLRSAAQALGLSWPASTSLRDYQRTLDPSNRQQAALMLEIRRAGSGASYQPSEDGVVPWHEAMAATYAHATAPLRRLADRYVVRCVLAIANGHQPVHQFFASAEDGERIAAADRFAERAEVGSDLQVLLRPARAHPKRAQHFVEE